MPRNIRLFGSLVLAFMTLSACGSPFIKGWRNTEKESRTPQEQCSTLKGFHWIEGSCQKDGDSSLNDVSEEQCKTYTNATWLSDKCVYFKDLETAELCSTVGWKWAAGSCRLPAEADCLADSSKQYIKDKCVVRPTLALTGDVTQIVSAGAVFTPLDLVLSAGALAEVSEPQTCPGFFKIDAGKLTSSPATAGTSCEADLVAHAGGATSLPVHVTAKIDAGFLSYCNDFTKDPAKALAEREMARTVFILKQASKKTTCDEVAKELGDATSIDLANSGVTDLRPLTGFTKLLYLDLTGDLLKDLSPVAHLPSLETIGQPRFKGAHTEANCPTTAGFNFAVADFCLSL